MEEKNRSRAFTRKMNWLKALRKRRIDREVSSPALPDYYDNLHQYSKNKIHCSCPDCRGKESHLGENSPRQRKISEQRKVAGMDAAMREEFSE